MSESSQAHNHYGMEAVSLAFRHFLVGKAFVVVSSVTVMFVLAAELDPNTYAVYVSLQALIALLGQLSELGISNAMQRYLPELRSTGKNRSAYRLLWQGTLFRAAVLASVLGATTLVLPSLGRWFDLSDWLWLVPWYFGVGFLRLMAQWVGIMLESFLWQREAQYPVALGRALKLAAVLFFLGDLDLALVVAIEFATEALALFALLAALIWRWRGDQTRHCGTDNWWQDNSGRVLRYGLWAFLHIRANMLYGSAPNRLLVAHYLPTAEIALYGLADNLCNLIRRFMPMKLFIGLIRPIANARFSTTGDSAQVVSIADFAYRLNLSVLLLGISLLTTVGEPVLDALTNGKYTLAAPLVAGMLVLLISEGMGQMLQILAQAVERNSILVFTKLIQSASLLVAIPLLPVLGLWGLVVSNLGAVILSNLVTIAHLSRHGHALHPNWGHVASIVGYALASGLLGFSLRAMGLHFLLVTSAICVLFGALYFLRPPLTLDEREILLRLLPHKISQRLPGLGVGADTQRGKAIS